LATVAFAVAAVVVAAMLTGATVVRRPTSSSMMMIQMAGSDDFFDEQAVRQEFARNGIIVQQHPLGSQLIAKVPDLATAYDIANAGSYEAAKNIEHALDAQGADVENSTQISTPMVILTDRSIVDLLLPSGLVTDEGGFLVFHVERYLAEVVSRGMRWKDIPHNLSYSNDNQILVSTTDPGESNSGGMFAAIASFVTNNNTPIKDVRPDDTSLDVVINCFKAQGSMADHTPKLLSRFLTVGTSRYPMAMVYERDYLATLLLHPEEVPPHMVAMYPTPTVISDETLVQWKPRNARSGRAAKVVELLNHDPILLKLEEQSGARTANDRNQFVADMAAKDIKVPDLAALPTGLQVASLPSDAVLQKLIAAIEKGIANG
jgi:hypothetical protein